MTIPAAFDRKTNRKLRLKLDLLDATVARWMASHGITCLRVSLGIIFLWFGALKLFPGLSPAEDLVGRTIFALTGGLVTPSVSVPVLGLWETMIGVGLITGRALRLALVIFFVQMIGTATPLILFPAEAFLNGPFVLSFEGQYIIKNIVFVSAAFVVAATVRGGRLKADRTGEYSRTALGIDDLDDLTDPDGAIIELDPQQSNPFIIVS